MERPLRIAIIGCGWAGACHARAFVACGADVRWAVDTEARRAGALKESLGKAGQAARTGVDYGEALSDAGVDAVAVCLPHALHAPVTVEAAAVGKHVLCEKPMACSLAEADRMIAAADDAGVTLMIAENVRFNPLLHRVRGLLREGVIGRPALIQVTRQAYLARSFLEGRRWFLDTGAAGGGIMMSGGVHDFETMRMLAGEAESVYALRARQRFAEMEGDDTSVALVRFRNGAVGMLVESFVSKSLTTATGPEIHTLRVDGDLGSLAVEDGHTIQLFSERDDFLLGGSLAQHNIHVPLADTFLAEAEHFVQSIRTATEPVTGGRSQRRPLELVLAAYESMQSGQPVALC